MRSGPVLVGGSVGKLLGALARLADQAGMVAPVAAEADLGRPLVVAGGRSSGSAAAISFSILGLVLAVLMRSERPPRLEASLEVLGLGTSRTNLYSRAPARADQGSSSCKEELQSRSLASLALECQII